MVRSKKKKETMARHNQKDNHNHHHQQQQQQQQQRQHQHAQQTSMERTKIDYEIANYLQNKLEDKEASFNSIKKVKYFIGSKAVDVLMESKWAATSTDDNTGALFKTRDAAANLLNDLLLKNFYHRAKKLVKVDGGRKKFKLDMHDIQVFEDSKQPYVWLYERTSLKAWLLSIGVIFAIIAVCLFPLWPSFIRTGIYYLCIAGLVFLSSLLTLAIIRHIIFFILWTITFGKLHLWILPNLTEDVGFFESFWPLYTIGQCSIGAEGSLSSASSGDAGGSHAHQD